MFGLGVTELLLILGIVLLLFGTKKLKNLGSDLGGAIKGFRSALGSEPESETDKNAKPGDDARVIDGESTRSKQDANV